MPFTLVPGPHGFCLHIPDSTYVIHFQGCRTTFVLCGMKSLHSQGKTRMIAPLSIFCVGFAIATSLYIKALTQPQLHSPTPPTITPTFYSSHRRIPCVPSPVIAQIRPFMTQLLLAPLSPHLPYSVIRPMFHHNVLP